MRGFYVRWDLYMKARVGNVLLMMTSPLPLKLICDLTSIRYYSLFSLINLQGPISLSRNAPMELVFELFSKLGLRYLCIVDGGDYVGVVHKKMFLAYIKGLEKKSS